MTLAGRPLVVETGKVAQLANGSASSAMAIRLYSTATASEKPREGV